MRLDRFVLQRWLGFAALALGALFVGNTWCVSQVAAADESPEVTSDADFDGEHADGDHDEGGHGDDHADGDHGHGDGHGDGEHGSHGGVTASPISWDPDLAVVTAIIFLLLMLILGKFAWGPIIEGLDRRESAIAEQIAAAKENQEKAAALLADHESKMASAAGEVKQMLEAARKDADTQKQQILDSAQAAASAEKDRAVREITAAKNTALQEMAQKSVDSAVGLAGKIVKRQLNNDDHSQLINDALDKFSSDN